MNKKIIIILGIIAIASVFILDQTIRYDMWRNIMEEDNFNQRLTDGYSYSPKLLELVIESCGCQADSTQGCYAFSAQWTNGTHRIDNTQCAYISESDGCTITTPLFGTTYTIECVH